VKAIGAQRVVHHSSPRSKVQHPPYHNEDYFRMVAETF
jgi:hypothetical protein